MVFLIKRCIPHIFLFLTIAAGSQAQDTGNQYYEGIIESLRESLEDEEAVADSLEGLGKKYRGQAKYDTALAYFNRSLMIREAIGSPRINRSYLFLGVIAGTRKEFDLSIDHFRKVIELSKQNDDSVSLGQVYNSIAFSFTETGELDSAIKYQTLALQVKAATHASPTSILSSLNNLGHTYFQLEEFDSAAHYFVRVINHPAAKEKPDTYVGALNNVGYWKYQNQQYDSARTYYLEGLKIAERDSINEILDDLYTNLAVLYIDLQNDSAKYFLDRYAVMQNILYSSETNRIIQDLRTKYDMEKKENELERQQLALERQEARTRLYIISGGTIILLLCVLLAFLFYRQKLIEQLRKKDEDLHNQKVNELLHNQEISVLSARVEGQDMERQRIAEDLHDQLGSKLAAVKLYYDAAQEGRNENSLGKARQLLDETITETRRIAHNLSSGVLTKFGLITAISNLQETLQNSKQIDIEFVSHNLENHVMSKDLEINFYRIIQELVSNILKHARATHITIQLTRHSDGLVTLIVEDNGKGFDPENVSLDSMGLTNLKNRVARFEGALNIDSEPGHGTTVIVEIHENQNQAA